MKPCFLCCSGMGNKECFADGISSCFSSAPSRRMGWIFVKEFAPVAAPHQTALCCWVCSGTRWAGHFCWGGVGVQDAALVLESCAENRKPRRVLATCHCAWSLGSFEEGNKNSWIPFLCSGILWNWVSFPKCFGPVLGKKHYQHTHCHPFCPLLELFLKATWCFTNSSWRGRCFRQPNT